VVRAVGAGASGSGCRTGWGGLVLMEEWSDPEPLVHSLPEVEHDAPAGCDECVRLFDQARAAVLTGDQSRLSDVRVYQRRHVTAEHPQEGRA